MRRRHTRRGSTALEFALVTPVLVVLSLGVIEYGRLFHQLSFLHVIANDAARTGSMQPLDQDPDLKAEAKAHELLWSYDIRCIYCVETSLNLGTYDTLTVQLRQPYIPIAGIIPTPLWLTTESTMMMWEQI